MKYIPKIQLPFFCHKTLIVSISFGILSLLAINSFAQISLKGIDFSHSSGFYDAAFDLSISIENLNAKLYFTIDGSNPETSATRINNGNAARISIDPSIDSVRPTTPAFLVRAIGMLGDSIIAGQVSQTYIFLDHVKKQNYPGGNWPYGGANGQFIDLNMDKKVVESSLYTSQMDDALLDIPSISVITDNDNLFGSSAGIYVNAHGHGKKWERPCSIELINPDGSDGFYENAGLRIRGGWSRHPEFAKHAFRVFFREEYGASKLQYPLFEDEGVNEFDKIDLRCAQNYAWSKGNGEHNTFVREVFARDTQGEMGQPYTRSRYYHLYLNGMYWGLFQTQERAEARFAESYLGGDKDDYDVVKVNVENYIYEMEATDGNLDIWSMIWERSRSSFSPNSSYFILEGKNSIGKPIPGQEVLVDIENLIDYMLIVFYTGSFDAPVTQFRGNDFPNNFYAINNRNDKSQGFVFFAHDLEHSLMIDPVNVGLGLNENRVNIGSINGDRQMVISEFKYFNPQWLHYRLSINKEYQLRFADRAALHLSNNGVFTEEQALKRFNKRAAQIDKAIIGESARWGDTRTSIPYTKDNAWIPELNEVRNVFFVKRPNIVIGQLRSEGLYSTIGPPEYYASDTLFNVSEFDLKSNISIKVENPNGEGEIYYTLNGQDPRLVGGFVSSDAKSITHGNSMDFNASAVIKSRIKSGDEWSALRIISLISTMDDLSNLKVTEIHYHPEDQIDGADTLDGKDLEFIEFKNIGETALNLSGIKIDSAVTYTFPENTILPPGQFYVVASKPSLFYEVHGRQASGNYKGNLSNSGEEILVTDANNNILINFTYNDTTPWPEEADGNGPSLASVDFNPTNNPVDYGYWRLSVYNDGTPFRDDKLITALEDLEVDRFESIINIFPNPASDNIIISVPGISEDAILSIKILNLHGQIMLESRIINNDRVDLSQLASKSGLFVLTIQSNHFFGTSKVLLKGD